MLGVFAGWLRRLDDHSAQVPVLLAVFVMAVTALLVNSRDVSDFRLQYGVISAIVHQGSVTVEDARVYGGEVPPGDTFTKADRRFAAKQLGSMVLGAVAYAPLAWLGADIRQWPRGVAAGVWTTRIVNAAGMGAVTFLLAWLVLCRWKLPEGQGLLLIAAMMGTALLPYGGVIHHDHIAALLIAGGVGLVLAARTGPSWMWAGGAVALGLVPHVSILPVPLMLALYGWVLWSGWRAQCLRLVLVPLVVLGLLWGAVNWVMFGNPLTPANIAGDYADTFAAPNWARAKRHFTTYFLGGDLSLAVFSPVLLPGLAGWLLVIARSLLGRVERLGWGKPDSLVRQLVPLAVAITLGSLLHVGYLLSIETVGHCQYGPRYLLPLMPLWALGLVPLGLVVSPVLGRGRLMLQGVLVLLALWGLALAVLGAMGGIMYCNIRIWPFIPYWSSLIGVS